MNDASQYQLWQAAKKYLRAHPGATDEQVAEACGITERIRLVSDSEMRTIREARKDLQASSW